MARYSFEIRHATIEDIPAIQEITKEAFIKYMELADLTGKIAALEETHEDIKKDIETKEVFVAFLDGTPVGSVRVEVSQNKTAYLSRFGVRLDYQNNGVGKALMNVVDMAMKEMGVKQMCLHTASKDRGYIRALLCKDYK